jgi:hypothetical protein
VGFIILYEQVWDLSHGEGLIGGATIILFNNKKQLKTGKQKLRPLGMKVES